VLKNISFDFKNFEKVAIIGRVGCGKSTLLSSILKEAFIQSGSVQILGTELIAAYAEQSPLIITGTVRSNILYGSPYEPAYYEKVIKTCQLVADFDQFPKKDLTETGEMGVSLSGG
jgi:ABC-type multidrug transport system fused ATPase/permease subunit